MLKYLIFSILFQFVAAARCSSGCVQYSKECLCFHEIPESFEVAKTTCLKEGGRLAGIENFKANEFIFQQAILNNLQNDLWIDTTPQQVSQKIFKVPQKTAEFSNWNLQQKQTLQLNTCSAMSLTNAGKWFTTSCTTLKPYICSSTADSDFPTTQQSPSDPATTEAADECIDQIASCQQYLNECSDPDYQPMLYKFCRKTCNLCSQCMDSDPQCPTLAADGFCTNPVYKDKWSECSKTCKLC